MKLSIKSLAILAFPAIAECFTITFLNQCGMGSVVLKHPLGTENIPNLGTFTTSAPLFAGIAYLQTGSCGSNGENCTAVGMDVTNLGFMAYINLIPPRKFSVPVKFIYTGSNNTGATCNDANCPAAIRTPLDLTSMVTYVQPNIEFNLTFCM